MTWGASAAEIQASGVDLRGSHSNEFGTTFVASRLPKPIADTEKVFLSFGNDDKLWRIVVQSRTYENDPAGTAVKARYHDLVEALNEKYGPGTSFHQIDEQFWKAPDEFIIGITAGRTKWLTGYDTASLLIEIGIVGLGKDEADWQITFEKKQLRSAFERSKKTNEKSAL